MNLNIKNKNTENKNTENNMNKICTSIAQSKRLLELGIDINTADMMWDDWNLIDEGWKLSVDYHPEIEQDYGRKCYPAWSLTALLEYMNRNFYNISLNYCGSEYTISFDDGEQYKTITKDYSIDAAFEMICWLKENRKL